MAGNFDIYEHFEVEIIQENDMGENADDIKNEPSDDMSNDQPVTLLSMWMCRYCSTVMRNSSEKDMHEHLRTCDKIPSALSFLLKGVGLCNITLGERMYIMQAMKELYSNKFYNNFNIFFEKMKHMVEYKWTSADQLKKAMADAGYILVKCENRSIVMENPKLRFERYNYLKKIVKARQKDRHIYFVDEIHIEIESDTLVIRKPTAVVLSQEDFDYHPKLFYVCSSDGCTNTLFSFCLGKGDYMKWIVHSLIPSLKPGSVVVMDNGFLHGSSEEAHITPYHTKSDMISWLENRNIPCHTSMHKAELFELIDKSPYKDNNGKLERIFKANGHEVVRVPCQMHHLSLCTMMLDEIKGSLQLKPKSGSLSDRQMTHLLIKLKLSEAIKAIPVSKWNEFSNIIQKYEKDFLNIDCEIEDLLDMNYKIDLSDIIPSTVTNCYFCTGKDDLIWKGLMKTGAP